MKIDKLKNDVHNYEAMEGIEKLPDNSIDMVMFSPPYYLARNYGDEETRKIWNGNDNCDHEWDKYIREGISGGKKSEKVKIKGEENYQLVDDTVQAFCKKCGAWRGSFGLEPNPNMYIKHLTNIVDKLSRVVKSTGNLYINLGDKYTKKEKELIPHRTARRITKNTEWNIRQDLIWRKNNPMPHPVNDRLNNTFEYIFHFVLDLDKYYYDLDSIREPYKTGKWKEMPPIGGKKHKDNINKTYSGNTPSSKDKGKNPGDIFDINTSKSDFDHLAVYPIELCKKPIKSSCPKNGIVLDPFSGSGSTLVAAQKYNRQWIGFDINKKYTDISKVRIKKECSDKIDNYI